MRTLPIALFLFGLFAGVAATVHSKDESHGSKATFTFGDKQGFKNSLPTEAELTRTLLAIPIGETRKVGTAKVTRIAEGQFKTCDGDACIPSADIKKTVKSLIKPAPNLMAPPTATAPSAFKGLMEKPTKKAPRPEGVVDIKSASDYARALKEETRDLVVMTYSSKTSCNVCRTLSGDPKPGDAVIPQEQTLKGLSKRYADKASFYSMDIDNPEISAYYQSTGQSKIPFTAIYRREPDGKMTHLGQVTGSELASKLKDIKEFKDPEP